MSEFYGDSTEIILSKCNYDDIFEIANDAEEFYKLIRKQEYSNFIKEHINEYNKIEKKMEELYFEDYFRE